MKTNRPNLHSYFLAIAQMVATRATCPRLQCGTVLVKDKNIIATGYNGAPSGLPSCDEVGCLIEGDHCIRVVHAEANAIAQAAKHGHSVNGATAYVTAFPCVRCAAIFINAGIKEIHCDIKYLRDTTDAAIDMLRSAKINLIKHDLSKNTFTMVYN